MEIEVIDQIMGTGKSYSALRYIENLAINDSSERWIFCTEYLEEIDKRTKENDEAKHLWRTPVEGGDETKTDKLIELLAEPKVQLIGITHALLLSASGNLYVNHLIKTKGYKLFLDETLELINPYNGVNLGDFRKSWARNELSIDAEKFGKVSWLVDDTAITLGAKSCTDKLKQDCAKGIVHCGVSNSNGENKESLSLVEIDNEVLFTQFNRVIVATYNIDDTLFDAYLKIKGINRGPCKTVSGNRVSTKSFIKSNIEFISKYDKAFDKMSLSSRWYDGKSEKASTKEDYKLINKTIKAIGDNNGCKGNAHLLGFTVPADKLGKQRDAKKIQPVGYPHTVCSVIVGKDGNEIAGDRSKALSAYVPCNARASNEYSNKNVMIHIYNRYPMPTITNYLKSYDVQFSSEAFALNELVQWVWRSAIRNGQPIKLAILSNRMRDLFKTWLDT